MAYILSQFIAGRNPPASSLLYALENELREGLAMFWEKSRRIMEGSGVRLKDPPEGYFSLEKNFFSTLFLYSYCRCRIGKRHRIFYSSVNQCLRAMVTGCDNLLDDEYKMTLNTDLPENGIRFRSVLDIMVADRVLFELLLDFCHREGLDRDLVARACEISLKALVRSGAQEASEEGGVNVRPTPEKVLSDVHHFKTGLLFQCVWAVPETLEKSIGEDVETVKRALYEIGMGCQILDDIVDLVYDARARRHNYVASLICHEPDEKVRLGLERLAGKIPEKIEAQAFYSEFPLVFRKPCNLARQYLSEGLGGLFDKEFQYLVAPALVFIERLIGVDRILEAFQDKEAS